MGKTAYKQRLLRLEQREQARAKLKESVSRGELRAEPVQCCGVTTRHARCTTKTRFPNRYCARHQQQTRHGREEWLVESAAEPYTNVSQPVADRPFVGRVYGEVVSVNGAVSTQLVIPNAIAEERVGALSSADLYFLS